MDMEQSVQPFEWSWVVLWPGFARLLLPRRGPAQYHGKNCKAAQPCAPDREPAEEAGLQAKGRSTTTGMVVWTFPCPCPCLYVCRYIYIYMCINISIYENTFVSTYMCLAAQPSPAILCLQSSSLENTSMSLA